jgi:hypothetical protein
MTGAVSGTPDADYVWLLITGVTLTGSVWFTTAEGQEMADLAGSGALDLTAWRTRTFALADINEALAVAADRQGGFSGRCLPHRGQHRRAWQCSSVCACTRRRCRLARTSFTSVGVSPSVAAVQPVMALPPACTSCA